eukprot:jgi/Psemu1/53822/gm1.53822_g
MLSLPLSPLSTFELTFHAFIIPLLNTEVAIHRIIGHPTALAAPTAQQQRAPKLLTSVLETLCLVPVPSDHEPTITPIDEALAVKFLRFPVTNSIDGNPHYLFGTYDTATQHLFCLGCANSCSLLQLLKLPSHLANNTFPPLTCPGLSIHSSTQFPPFFSGWYVAPKWRRIQYATLPASCVFACQGSYLPPWSGKTSLYSPTCAHIHLELSQSALPNFNVCDLRGGTLQNWRTPEMVPGYPTGYCWARHTRTSQAKQDGWEAWSPALHARAVLSIACAKTQATSMPTWSPIWAPRQTPVKPGAHTDGSNAQRLTTLTSSPSTQARNNEDDDVHPERTN